MGAAGTSAAGTGDTSGSAGTIATTGSTASGSSVATTGSTGSEGSVATTGSTGSGGSADAGGCGNDGSIMWPPKSNADSPDTSTTTGQRNCAPPLFGRRRQMMTSRTGSPPHRRRSPAVAPPTEPSQMPRLADTTDPTRNCYPRLRIATRTDSIQLDHARELAGQRVQTDLEPRQLQLVNVLNLV